MSLRASGDVAARKMMDSNASPSLAQPGDDGGHTE